MKIEFQCTDEILSNKELLDIVESAQSHSFVSKISVLPPYIKFLKNKIKDSIKLSAIVDYPFGILDTKSRLEVVNKCISDGAESIEMVLPSFLLTNKQTAKIKQDIESVYSICSDKSINLHYVLEYRSYNYSCLARIVKLLLNYDLNDIYISTGHRIDDIYDHIIAIAMITKHIPDANIICNANIYNTEHLGLLKLSNLQHFRVNSIYTLDLINRKCII